MVDTIVSGLRDCVFFLVVGFLGFHHVIGEPILAALLSAYTAHRFGVSMGKQSAVIALNSSNGPGGGGGGGPSSSGSTRAVPEPPPSPPRKVDQRTLRSHDLGLDTGAYRALTSTMGGIG